MDKKTLGWSEQIKNWIRDVFALSDSAYIDISEDEYINDEGNISLKTNIIIKIAKNPNTFTILKSSSEICLDDIVFLKKSMESYALKNYPLRSRIYKFFGWWFIFAGSLAFFSVCPICGQSGCPVGLGTTGILAGILSLIKTGGKNCIDLLKNLLKARDINYGEDKNEL